MHTPTLPATLLGHDVAYPERYDASLLQGIARQPARNALGLDSAATLFVGADIWRAYEVSWLNPRGKPMIAMATITVPADSPCLIESKSLKLYLNGHNQTQHSNIEALHTVLTRDLSAVAGAPVQVVLHCNATAMATPALCELEGECLDDLDIAIDTYTPTPALLRCQPEAETVSETLMSCLLRSNCPVTGQPDWGSIQVQYQGPAIERASLLRYLVSFRTHTGFHEQCVEQVFRDILAQCRPTALRVFACYTRRGGLDINPWRATPGLPAPTPQRTPRQ